MWWQSIMAWNVAGSLCEEQRVPPCKTILCTRADRNRLWRESIRAATAFISFLLVAGEQEPAAACAWSSTKIEIRLVFISQSSRHLSSPPFLPSLPLSSKWRAVTARMEHTRDAGNEGGGGLERWWAGQWPVTLHLNAVSPTHDRNGKWGKDSICLCTSRSLRCGKFDWKSDSALQCDLSVTQFSLKKYHKENTSSEMALFFLGQEARLLSF